MPARGRVSHGSILSGNLAPARVTSQRKSTRRMEKLREEGLIAEIANGADVRNEVQPQHLVGHGQHADGLDVLDPAQVVLLDVYRPAVGSFDDVLHCETRDLVAPRPEIGQ